jgi:hypothetical protein
MDRQGIKKWLAIALAIACGVGFAGCALTPEATASSEHRPKLEGGELLEVVTVARSDGSRGLAVLSRRDIIATLGAPPSSWSGISLDFDRLIQTVREIHFGTKEQPGKIEYAETFLKGCEVGRRYSLADLGVRDGRALLEKFFERRSYAPGEWWIRKSASRTDAVEENGLIALMKDLGFQASRAEIAPVLLVLPPADLR